MSSYPPNSDQDLLWTPSNPAQTQTSLFREHIKQKYSISLITYEDLYNWSIDHRADFWSSLWDWENVIGFKGNHMVDEKASPEDNPKWFEASRLDWAENQLRHSVSNPDDIAVIQTSESTSSYTPPTKRITQSELNKLVGKTQRSLIKAGVRKGDRIAFWGGNVLEAVVLVLATSSLGGIFSSAASDFGVDGVKERLEQIKPKLLFVTNGVIYNGVIRPLLPLLPKLLDSLQDPPEKVVIIYHLPEDLVGIPKELNVKDIWDNWLDDKEETTKFEQLDFNDPIWILFSSGTTGKPKAIVVS